MDWTRAWRLVGESARRGRWLAALTLLAHLRLVARTPRSRTPQPDRPEDPFTYTLR